MPTAPGTVPIKPVIDRSRFCRRFAGGASSHTRQAASRAARHLIVLPPVEEAASDGSLPRPTGTLGPPVDHLTSGKCQKRCAPPTAKGADRSAGSQVRGVDLELREQRGLVPQGPAGRDEGALNGDDGDREDLGPAAGRGDARQQSRQLPVVREADGLGCAPLAPAEARLVEQIRGPRAVPGACTGTPPGARVFSTGSVGDCRDSAGHRVIRGLHADRPAQSGERRTRAESASAISGLPRDPQPSPTALSTRHAHLHPAPAPRRPRRTPSRSTIQ